MSLPFPQKTTCDIYHHGNSPPAAPDVESVACVLEAAWERGREAGEGENANLRYTHLLHGDRATDLRDGFELWNQGNTDTVYIPDKDGLSFIVRFVELVQRRTARAHRQAYLDRRTVAWPFPAPASGTAPAAHWKLNDASGSAAQDSSGNGNDGTLTNGPVWVAGDAPASTGYSACLEFDGSNDYVAIADSSAFDLSGDFTVTVWTKWDNAADYQVLGHNAGSGDNNPKWVLGRGVKTAGKLEFHINGPGLGQGVEPIAFTWTPSTGTWIHLAVTRSGNTFKLYIDRAEQQSATSSTAITDPAAELRIGQSEGGFFDGRLSDVRLYTRALSATEISNLYNSGSP